MSWNPFSTEISNKMHTNMPQLPPPKTLASLAVLTTSFFTMQNVVQRLVGSVGLYAGRVMPLTTPLGLVATTASIYGSNYVAFEFEKFWDKEIDKLPARKSKSLLVNVAAFFKEANCAKLMNRPHIFTKPSHLTLLFHRSPTNLVHKGYCSSYSARVVHLHDLRRRIV